MNAYGKTYSLLMYDTANIMIRYMEETLNSLSMEQGNDQLVFSAVVYDDWLVYRVLLIYSIHSYIYIRRVCTSVWKKYKLLLNIASSYWKLYQLIVKK